MIVLYIAVLDASKAFERVHYGKLFSVLYYKYYKALCKYCILLLDLLWTDNVVHLGNYIKGHVTMMLIVTLKIMFLLVMVIISWFSMGDYR